MTITGSELMNITAPDLVIGGGQTTDINVGGVTAGQSANIANLRLEAADRITFSGGIADVLAFPTPRAALKAADDALYLAKGQGRNRVIKADGEIQAAA